MGAIYKNITGNTAEALYEAPENGRDLPDFNSLIPFMNIANIHATDAVSVTLYLSRIQPSPLEERKYVGQNGDWNPLLTTTDIYNICYKLSIPVFSSVLLEQPELNYDNTKYNLYIKLNASDSAVDVIIGELTEVAEGAGGSSNNNNNSMNY